jgi:hypothetical protein
MAELKVGMMVVLMVEKWAVEKVVKMADYLAD